MSSAPGTSPRSDLYFSVLNRSSWHYFGRRLATLGVMIHKPFSRGRVHITSADPLSPPRVDFGFLSDRRDVERLAAGVRTAARILAHKRVRDLGLQAGLIRPSRLTHFMGTRSMGNRALDVLFSSALPLLPRLQHRLFEELPDGQG